MNIYKSNSFLHLPNTFSIFLMLLCLLSDEINTYYIKCCDCTCSYTYIVLAIILSQFHEIVLVKSFYFMMSLLIYNLTSTPTHPLIQTNKISHRGSDSEIVLRAQKPVLAFEPNCVVYIFIDTA